MTKTRKKAETTLLLDRVPCIHHTLYFKKDYVKIQTFINFGSKINAIAPGYTVKLSLNVWFIDVEAQNIHGSTFKTFDIILASLQIKDQLGRPQSFQKTFLIADTNLAVILSMFFLIFSNADMLFIEQKLIWRSYIPVEALSRTQWVRIIDQNKFSTVALNLTKEAFVVYVAHFEGKMTIYSAYEA